MMNKKKFFSLVAGKIEVGQYIHQHFSRFIKIINHIENLYKTSTDKGKISVLDFGSHTGVLGIALKTLGYDIYGIDLAEVIATNLSAYMKNEIKVQSLKNNWDGLPYPDNFFDCVIFSEVLEHLYESPIKFLEEIHRILKPGGNLLLTTPNVMRTENR